MNAWLRTSWRTLLPIATLAAILITGWVHGVWTDRWSNHDAELAQAGERLRQLTLDLGEWKGRELTIHQAQLEEARLAGYVRRVYTHPRKKERLSLLVMCGKPGPLSAHTPEYCYGGAGYEMVGEAVPINISLSNGGQAKLFLATFHKPGGFSDPPLRILWGWSTQGEWDAVSSPRFTYVRASVLHKLYAIREMGTTQEPLRDEPLIPFLQDAIPQLNQELFAPVKSD